MIYGVKTRIVLISACAMLFAMGAVIALSSYLFGREYREALQSRSFAIATSLKVQLERVLQFGIPLTDLVGFEEQCREVAESNAGVAYAMVLDPAGQILFHSEPGLQGELLANADLVAAARSGVKRIVSYTANGTRINGALLPVTDAFGEHLGCIVVGFPDALITSKLKGIIALDLGLGLICLAIGMLILVTVLSALVTKPLVRLIDSIQGIRRNATDLSRRVNLPIKGDFRRLAATFNDLMQELQNTTVSKDALESTLRVLEEAENRYRRVVENSPSAIFIDCCGRLVFVNPAGVGLLGAARSAEICDRPLLDFVEPEARDRMKRRLQSLLEGTQTVRIQDVRLIRKDGTLREVEITGIAFVYDGQPAVQVVAHDVTVTRQKSAQLEHMASHDALTELPNRTLLQDRLERTISHAGRSRTMVAVLFMDLDRFKLVNDTQGHTAGDLLLVQVARRLQASLRKSDTVARFGGDEFVLVLSDIEKTADVDHMAEAVRSVLAEPFFIGEQEVYVGSSIGISLYPQDGENAELLLRNADIAMYRAKELGRNNHQYYTEELNAQVMERNRLHQELRRAIEEEQFLLHYQPQLDLISGRVVAMEALVRWQHPRLGLIPPADFIPLAEETGLIVPLGAWVLREACRQAKSWQQEGLPPVRVAVNLAMRQLADEGLVGLITEVLLQTGLTAEFLELELTETDVMQEAEEMRCKLRRLKDLGVFLSLDDFGTGYSSLSYLKRFAFDCLKIDRSFVRDITTDSDDKAIVQTIIAVAKSLGMIALAEGVETVETLTCLRAMGCHHAQGYLISRPLPSDEAGQMLRTCISGTLPLGDATKSSFLYVGC